MAATNDSTEGETENARENKPVPTGPRIFEKIYNFRDVGSVTDTARKGLIFRSATLSEATERDLDLLVHRLKVKTIIDLRTTMETWNQQPPKIQKYFQVIYADHHSYEDLMAIRKQSTRALIKLPVLPSKLSFFTQLSYRDRVMLTLYYMTGLKSRANPIVQNMMAKLKLEGLYKLLLHDSQQEIATCLKLLSNEDNYPLIVHCTQGKDRTGLIIMLLMMCLGVDMDIISQDYQRSEKELELLRQDPEYLKKSFHQGQQLGLDMTSWMRAPAETFQATVEHLETEWGGVNRYMDLIGFSEEFRRNLRRNLTNRSRSSIPGVESDDLIRKKWLFIHPAPPSSQSASPRISRWRRSRSRSPSPSPSAAPVRKAATPEPTRFSWKHHRKSQEIEAGTIPDARPENNPQ